MTKLENKKLSYIASSLIILNGLICIIYGEKLLPLVPIVCGGSLLIKGIIQFIKGIREKDYASLTKKDMEKSFIAIAMGIGILIKKNDALFIVGMFWGLHGLMKSADYLNIALYNIVNKEKWLGFLMKAIVEFILSFILVFDPFGKLGHHIAILGLELIFDGTTDIFSQNKKKLD